MERWLVESDDEIYQYDRTFLGPPDLPWLQIIQARYVTWGIWLVTFVALVLPLEALFGHSPSDALGQVVWAAGLAACVSWLISSRIDREKPVPAVLQGLWWPRFDAVVTGLDRRRAADVGAPSTPASGGRRGVRYPVLQSRACPGAVVTPSAWSPLTCPGDGSRESSRAWSPAGRRVVLSRRNTGGVEHAQ